MSKTKRLPMRRVAEIEDAYRDTALGIRRQRVTLSCGCWWIHASWSVTERVGDEVPCYSCAMEGAR